MRGNRFLVKESRLIVEGQNVNATISLDVLRAAAHNAFGEVRVTEG